MKIIVAIKRALDYTARVRVKPDGSGVDLSGARMSMNPFCEIALEEAIRLKEAGHAEEVVAVSVGPKECQEQLRTALALGADRVLHIDTTATGGSSSSSSSSSSRSDGGGPSLPPQTPGPRAVASLLARVVAEEGPRLVLLGKQAIDGDSAQTGPMLAGLLNWPQATFASKLVLVGGGSEGAGGGEREGDGGGGGGDGGGASPSSSSPASPRGAAACASVRVTREVDGGLQTLLVPLPAVVTADLRLNEPRYASLPAVMRAKKASIPTRSAADLGVDLARFSQQTFVTRVSPPPARKPGRKVGSVEELVEALVSEAKVL